MTGVVVVTSKISLFSLTALYYIDLKDNEWTVAGLRASILICFVVQETYRFPFSLYTKMQGCTAG
jgi:hypothetical protein